MIITRIVQDLSHAVRFVSLCPVIPILLYVCFTMQVWHLCLYVLWMCIMYNPIIGVCSNFYIFIAFDPTAWQWALSWDWGSVKSPHMVVSSGFWCKFNLYIICPPPLDNAAITSQPKPLPDTTRLTGNLHPEELKKQCLWRILIFWWPDTLVLYSFQSICSLPQQTWRFHSKITTVDNFSKCILLVFEITIRLALEGEWEVLMYSASNILGSLKPKASLMGL